MVIHACLDFNISKFCSILYLKVFIDCLPCNIYVNMPFQYKSYEMENILKYIICM